MKNRKSAKLLVLILSLALLIGSAVGIAVSAAGEKTPEIISKNVYYSGNNSIMYAVDADTVNEGPVTLKLYNDAAKAAELADTDWTYVAEAPQTEKIDGEDKSVYVFTTLGIDPTNFNEYFYAVAVDATGAQSAVVRYSLLEYYLDMLYRNDIKSATSGEGAVMKTLFESEIASAAAIQDLLFNYDADDTNDLDYLADDYYYAAIVDGATIDGAYSTGVFTPGSEITLTSTDGSVATWQVTVYNSDYSVKSSEKVANGTKITLDGHTLITVPEIPTTGVVDFEDGIPAELKATEANASGSITLGNDGAGDNYMIFATTGAGSADALPSFTVPVDTNDVDADTFVFGYDMKLDTVRFDGIDKYVAFLQYTAYAGDEMVYSVGIYHNGDRIRVYLMDASGGYNNEVSPSTSPTWKISRQEDQTVTNTNAHTEKQMYFVYNTTTDSIEYYNNNGVLIGSLTGVYGANLLPDKVVVTAIKNNVKLSARLDNIVTENYKAGSAEQSITFDPHTFNKFTITEEQGTAEVRIDETTGNKYLYMKAVDQSVIDSNYRNSSVLFTSSAVVGANSYEFSADHNILSVSGSGNTAYQYTFGGSGIQIAVVWYSNGRLKLNWKDPASNTWKEQFLYHPDNGNPYVIGTEFNLKFVAAVVGDHTEINVYLNGNPVNEAPITWTGTTLTTSMTVAGNKSSVCELTLDNVYSAGTVVNTAAVE